MARSLSTVANPAAFVVSARTPKGSPKRYTNPATGETVSRRTILNSQRGESVEAYRAELAKARVTDKSAPNVVEHGKPDYQTGYYTTARNDVALHSSERAREALARVPSPGAEMPIVLSIYGKWRDDIYRWRSSAEGEREREIEPRHWKSVSINRKDLEEALASDRDLEKAIANLEQRLPFDRPLDGKIYGITFRSGQR
jgi:hypothetical protein